MLALLAGGVGVLFALWGSHILVALAPADVPRLSEAGIDAGALVRGETGWRFDHEVPIEIPQTVERVIVARIDRLDRTTHQVLTAAAALGRRFGLALLEETVSNENRHL